MKEVSIKVNPNYPTKCVSFTVLPYSTTSVLKVNLDFHFKNVKIGKPRSKKSSVELGCCVLLNTPKPCLDPPNQNGTMAEDALLMEKFISAESVR